MRVDDGDGLAVGERFRQGFWLFGRAHGCSTCGIGETLAFEMAQEGAQAGKAAAERAGARAIAEMLYPQVRMVVDSIGGGG